MVVNDNAREDDPCASIEPGSSAERLTLPLAGPSMDHASQR